MKEIMVLCGAILLCVYLIFSITFVSVSVFDWDPTANKLFFSLFLVFVIGIGAASLIKKIEDNHYE